MGGALLAYLMSGQISWDSNQIVTAVPQGNILLLTGFASKAVLTSVPMVMSIAAYYVGDMWLNNSRSTSPTQNLPSPYQYGLLLSTFQGANIFSAYNGLAYRFSSRRAKLSPVVQASTIVLLIALILAYAVVAIDFGLHHVSSSMPAIFQSKSSDQPLMYGLKIKDRCLNTTETYYDWRVACTVDVGGHFGDLVNQYGEAIRLIAGVSQNHSITSLPTLGPDGQSTVQVAVFVPPKPAEGIAFTAKTVGQFAQCQNLNPSCQTVTTPGSGRMVYNCAGAGWPVLRGEDAPVSRTSFFINATLTTAQQATSADARSGTEENPYSLAAIVGVPDCDVTSGVDPESCTKDPGWIFSGLGTPYMFFGCKISVVDVQYSYSNGSYSIDNYNLASNSTTRSVTNPLYLNTFATFTQATLAPLALTGDSASFVGHFEDVFTRQTLAFSNFAFEPSPVLSQFVSEFVLATVLPTS